MEFAFAALTLDRAGESRQDNDWLQRRFDERDAQVLVLSRDGRVLIALPERHLLQVPVMLLRDRFSGSQFNFLGICDRHGAISGTPAMAGDVIPGAGAHALFALTLDEAQVVEFAREFNADALDLRVAASELSAQQAGAAAFARSLTHWQSRSRFCGTCGAATLLSSGGHRALCTNAQCAAEVFPRTDAAMIALVHDGERCLLGRQASWPENRYSTLAGFLEPGETLEACVRREVFEEVGVQIGECQYIASQPWPFPASLMIGFIARATTSEIRLGAEICEARWFSAQQLAENWRNQQIKLSPRLSISRHLIELWYQQQTGEKLS
ncbi:MAG: NAD(+) diphosphatase [Pseudomonadota bacterium]|nr:NAD(+) diphosphatase [Pseudomonadota bacterium]